MLPFSIQMMHTLCACMKHAEQIVKGFINFLMHGFAYFFRELKKKKKVDEPSEVVTEEKPEEPV